ncbi:hypothetical protein CALVIDRAFT_291419 [Calocera viscosa TUFC12733]|uniref:Uncharacterized protein n=1 Tax=Calocera viscosa (strain TUFC12733) TaxID=1330018 RepID=A0A167IT73_CALVF|nr:hypothetical protein CALVIDRAFT_291419 [Calocera viscosa TUFC12733]
MQGKGTAGTYWIGKCYCIKPFLLLASRPAQRGARHLPLLQASNVPGALQKLSLPKGHCHVRSTILLAAIHYVTLTCALGSHPAGRGKSLQGSKGPAGWAGAEYRTHYHIGPGPSNASEASTGRTWKAAGPRGFDMCLLLKIGAGAKRQGCRTSDLGR